MRRSVHKLHKSLVHRYQESRRRGLADATIREGWIRDKGMMVFQMYSVQTRMSTDIFVQYPVDFEELWSHGTKIDLRETSLRIASIDHRRGRREKSRLAMGD